MTPSLATQEKGVNGYDRKIIELISGKLGGETPNKSRQHFLFFYFYISGLYQLAASSQKS